MTTFNENSDVRRELLESSDAEIEKAVELANPMILRALLYQLTGDEEIRQIEVSLVGEGLSAMFAPSDEDQALLRRRTVDFLREYREAGAGPIEIGPPDRLPVTLDLAWGRELNGDQTALYSEELGLDPWQRMPEWREQPDREKVEDFNVLVIGAAMGGLSTAIQLKRAGIPFQVIEKNSGAGGTWFENRYPGIRVDVPSRGYTHLFGVDFEFPYPFSPGHENRRYYEWVIDKHELRPEIEFDTEAAALRWDEETATWEVDVRGPEGERTIRARAVITACGFLSRPSIPEIEGMADFKGPSWHTARWPEDFDHAGKRIAVVGTGASGYQMIPELAKDAAEVVVFQRTPQWVMGVPGYLARQPQETLWLERNLPFYRNFLRLKGVEQFEAFADLSEVDPEFDHPDAPNALNLGAREACIAFLEEKVSDPELVAKMIPKHPFCSARPLLTDSGYNIFDALQLEHVSLESDGIKRITETGIEAGDGTHHEVDAIVYATGFRAGDYLFPMSVTGREGKTINETWAEEGARAYRGCMLPGFPNLFMQYGPNTNGALIPIVLHEFTGGFALRMIEDLILEDEASVEVTEDAFWRYNEWLDERNRTKVWSDPRVDNYYKRAGIRSSTMFPFWPAEMCNLLRSPDYADLAVREHASKTQGDHS